MMLCLQTLFGTGTIFLFAQGKKKAHFSWDLRERNMNLQKKIAVLLENSAAVPSEITELWAIAGPGSFTALRNITVMGNTWKKFRPKLQIYAVPSGVFLRTQFPAARNLLLAAGKTAFFQFHSENSNKFVKLPNTSLFQLAESWGGELFPEQEQVFTLPKVFPKTSEEVFLELFPRKEEFLQDVLIPEYGAEANIGTGILNYKF